MEKSLVEEVEEYRLEKNWAKSFKITEMLNSIIWGRVNLCLTTIISFL